MSRHPILSDAPPSVSAETVPAEQWQLRAAKRLRSHDHLGAYDAAMRALSLAPDSTLHKHKALSALAGAGDAERARRLLAEFENYQNELDDDTIALKARLAFEHAMSARGKERALHAQEAAELYESIHTRTSGVFSGIHAATLWLLAGDAEKASVYARQVLQICERERPASPEEAYYIMATEAQASLVLGDLARAQRRLRAVRLLSGDNHAQSAALRKLFLPICEARQIPGDILSVLQPPPIIIYSGCQYGRIGFQSPMNIDEEIRLLESIATYLRTRGVGYGYGSLSCGPDILAAEQLLASGAKLCIVLPSTPTQCIEGALKSAGEEWTRRFESCLGAAARVAVVGEETDTLNLALWHHAQKTAMGLALLHAQALDAAAEHLVIESQADNSTECGSNSAVFLWERRGLPIFRIEGVPAGEQAINPLPALESDKNRVVRAMLFGEMHGADQVREREMLGFARDILGRIGRVLDEFGSDILFRGAWAERFGIACTSATAAAKTAIALQQAMADPAITMLGYPKELGLKLCAHLAPVFQGEHPITKQPAYFGTHIDRIAKLDMVLPCGQIYVTESFAASLMVESSEFQCAPVGKTTPKQGEEAISMYVLKPKP